MLDTFGSRPQFVTAACCGAQGRAGARPRAPGAEREVGQEAAGAEGGRNEGDIWSGDHLLVSWQGYDRVVGATRSGPAVETGVAQTFFGQVKEQASVLFL